jgi:hypothetical protein
MKLYTKPLSDRPVAQVNLCMVMICLVLQLRRQQLEQLQCRQGTLQIEASLDSADLKSTLPPWDIIVTIAELYLLYCDCQPLPLFERDSFMASLETRDPEVLLSLLALASRFSDDPRIQASLTNNVKGYTDAAKALVNRRVTEGPVEISTLQTLCLLSLLHFTSNVPLSMA